MILPMQDGRVEITDIQFPFKSLILLGDKDKNLFLTVEVNGTALLDTPVKLPSIVLQKLLSGTEVVTSEDLEHSGFFKIERVTDVGFLCIRFYFGTSEMGVFVTVLDEHLTLALRSLCDDSVISDKF